MCNSFCLIPEFVKLILSILVNNFLMHRFVSRRVARALIIILQNCSFILLILHGFSSLLLCKFEQANVQLCMLLQEHPIRNPCCQFQRHEHDRSLVVFHLRCRPRSMKLLKYYSKFTQKQSQNLKVNEISHLSKSIIAHFVHQAIQ